MHFGGHSNNQFPIMAFLTLSMAWLASDKISNDYFSSTLFFWEFMMGIKFTSYQVKRTQGSDQIGERSPLK